MTAVAGLWAVGRELYYNPTMATMTADLPIAKTFIKWINFIIGE